MVADDNASFVAANVTSTRACEIRTPDVVIKVSPDKTQMIESRVIDGIPYLLIQATDQIEINGIAVRSPLAEPHDDPEEEF